MTEPGWIAADWPAPANVHAGASTRVGGVSAGAWATLNLGGHVGDDPAAVAENRRRLARWCRLPAEPTWLQQVHGTTVVEAAGSGPTPEADGSFARQPGAVCAILTADCLPVLFCDRRGTEVAAAHAGWRGLAGGVLEATIAAMETPAAELLVWLGPAIGPTAFEVDADVRAAFVEADPAHAAAFHATGDKYLADIYALARRALTEAGVGAIHGGGCCTVSDPERFFSYRRDGTCGRMASLVWLAD